MNGEVKKRRDDRAVLVTGGAGFIGANLVRVLLDHGYGVTVLDNLSAGRGEYLEGLDITFVEGDILDAELVKRLVVGNQGVVHLAAQTGVPGSLADPRRDCEVNVIGTLNLLEACRVEKLRRAEGESVNERKAADDERSLAVSREAGPSGRQCGPRFILASSNAALGRQAPPASEDKVPLPISPYGASKLAAEGYCLAYHGSWGLATLVLRFGNVYGPFSGHKSSVVAKFFKNLVTTGEITVDGDGRQTRDFIYVDDLCGAIVLALESGVSGEVLQIAAGAETSILTLAALVEGLADRRVRIHRAPPRQGDIRRSYSHVSKASRILNWKPTVPLRAGLKRTLEWYLARRDRAPRAPTAKS